MQLSCKDSRKKTKGKVAASQEYRKTAYVQITRKKRNKSDRRSDVTEVRSRETNATKISWGWGIQGERLTLKTGGNVGTDGRRLVVRVLMEKWSPASGGRRWFMGKTELREEGYTEVYPPASFVCTIPCFASPLESKSSLLTASNLSVSFSLPRSLLLWLQLGWILSPGCRFGWIRIKLTATWKHYLLSCNYPHTSTHTNKQESPSW